MPRLPPDILRLARDNNAELERLDKETRKAIRRRFDAAADRLEQELRETSPETFRAQQARIQLLMARAVADETTSELEDILLAVADDATKMAGYDVADELTEWWNHYGYEARPPNFGAMASVNEEILVQRFEASLARWGTVAADRIQTEIAMAQATRVTRQVLTGAIHRTIDGERWQALRIARTETQHAYNASHHGTLKYARDSGIAPSAKKTCIVTWDDRTDEDSYPLEGQVRELDELFEDGDGRRYLHPPGRPNDREKEVPWLDDEPPGRPDPERLKAISEGENDPGGGKSPVAESVRRRLAQARSGGGDAARGSSGATASVPAILATPQGDRARQWAREEFDEDITDMSDEILRSRAWATSSRLDGGKIEGTDADGAYDFLSVASDIIFDPTISEHQLFETLNDTVDELEDLMGEALARHDELLDRIQAPDKIGFKLGYEEEDKWFHLSDEAKEAYNERARANRLAFVKSEGLDESYADDNESWARLTKEAKSGEMSGLKGEVEELRDTLIADDGELPVDLDTELYFKTVEDAREYIHDSADEYGGLLPEALVEDLPGDDIEVTNAKRRGFFRSDESRLELGKRGLFKTDFDDFQDGDLDSVRKTLWHELGHWTESSDRVIDAERRFLARRAKGLETTNIGFGDEAGFRDDFYSHYAGKYYGNRSVEKGAHLNQLTAFIDVKSAEVFTMGVQQFSSAERMVELLTEDREHFALIYAILTGRI